MKRKGLLIIFIFLSLIFVNLSLVIADGGYFPEPGYWLVSGQERAVIFYENNIETMILTSGFIGNAERLAWIIPTPSKPEVTKASYEVLSNIINLSIPDYSGELGFFSRIYGALEGYSPRKPNVIEFNQVDYYDIITLKITNIDELVNWFNENNYDYPEKYNNILKSYIDEGWYFTIIKISPESEKITLYLDEGNPIPIKMVFSSDKIVYPLRMSSIEFAGEMNKCIQAKDEQIGATREDESHNTWTKISNVTGGGNWKAPYSEYYSGVTWTDSIIDELPCGLYGEDYVRYKSSREYYDAYGGIPISLYVIADNKYENDRDPYIEYGNWITKSDIEKLGYDKQGNPFIQPTEKKYFLTSFYNYYNESEMENDLILRKSENNQKVNAELKTLQMIAYSLLMAIIVLLAWVFSPLGMLFVAGILILFLKSNKVARGFAWVITILSFLITVFIFSILMITILINSLNNYLIISSLITLLILLFSIIFLIIKAKRHKIKN